MVVKMNIVDNNIIKIFHVFPSFYCRDLGRPKKYETKIYERKFSKDFFEQHQRDHRYEREKVRHQILCSTAKKTLSNIHKFVFFVALLCWLLKRILYSRNFFHNSFSDVPAQFTSEDHGFLRSNPRSMDWE